MTKATILMLVAIFTTLGLQGQSAKDFDLTGYGKDKIAEMLANPGVEPLGQSEDGDMMAYRVEGVGVVFVFFENGLSNHSTFLPMEDFDMQKLIAALNEEAVVVSDDRWKIYYDTGYVTDVTLEYRTFDNGYKSWVFGFVLRHRP